MIDGSDSSPKHASSLESDVRPESGPAPSYEATPEPSFQRFGWTRCASSLQTNAVPVYYWHANMRVVADIDLDKPDKLRVVMQDLGSSNGGQYELWLSEEAASGSNTKIVRKFVDHAHKSVTSLWPPNDGVFMKCIFLAELTDRV